MGFIIKDLEVANTAIKRAWIAGVIVVLITSIIAFISIRGQDVLGLGYDKWIIVDILVFAVLTFGVAKKSRVCAILLLTFFVIGKISLFIQMKEPTGIGASLVWIFFFFQGVRGTFSYHRIIKQEKEQAKLSDISNKAGITEEKPPVEEQEQIQPAPRTEKTKVFILILIIFVVVVLVGLNLRWPKSQKKQNKPLPPSTEAVKGPRVESKEKTLNEMILGKTYEEVGDILGTDINEVTGSMGDNFKIREYKTEKETITVYFEKGKAVAVSN